MFINELEEVSCLNYQQFGHVQKFCTFGTPTYAKCPTSHGKRACPIKGTPEIKPKCALYSRLKKTM